MRICGINNVRLIVISFKEIKWDTNETLVNDIIIIKNKLRGVNE